MQKTNSRIEKESENETSLKLLLRSVQIDDNDHLAFYYLALQYMYLGMLNEAMVSCCCMLIDRKEAKISWCSRLTVVSDAIVSFLLMDMTEK